MKVPSLKKFKADDLGLLYVDTIRKWANAPHETHHSDLAVAIADELDRRGKPVPTDEVRAELDSLIERGLPELEAIRAKYVKA